MMLARDVTKWLEKLTFPDSTEHSVRISRVDVTHL